MDPLSIASNTIDLLSYAAKVSESLSRLWTRDSSNTIRGLSQEVDRTQMTFQALITAFESIQNVLSSQDIEVITGAIIRAMATLRETMDTYKKIEQYSARKLRLSMAKGLEDEVFFPPKPVKYL